MIDLIFPRSPDPYILNQQDQGLAKFGHLNALVHAINTQAFQCCTFLNIAYQTLNFNTTADQVINFSLSGTKFVITHVVFSNPSMAITVANNGQIYTGLSRTGAGTPGGVISAGNLITPDNIVLQTVSLIDGSGNAVYISGPLYFSLTTPQGSASTVDISVYGIKLS